MSRFGVGRMLALCLSVTLLAALVVTQPAEAGTSVEFDPDRLLVDLAPGEHTSVDVVVQASETFQDVRLDATPSLDGAVSVPDVPGGRLDAGASSLAFGLQAPPAAKTDTSISGTVRLRQGDRTLARPLRVQIRVVERDPGEDLGAALLSPQYGEQVTGEIELVGSVVGGLPPASVEFLADGEVVAAAGEPDGDGLHRADWDSATGTSGPRLLSLRASDSSGRTVESEVTLVQVSNELEAGPVSAFVLSQEVPLDDVVAALRGADLQPVAFDHRAPVRGGFHSWVLPLDTATSLYESAHEERHGGQPQVFAFTVHGEADADMLGDLGPLVAEQGTFDADDTLAFAPAGGGEDASITRVDDDAHMTRDDTASSFSTAASDGEAVSLQQVAVAAADNWWPDRGHVAGDDGQRETRNWLWPLRGPRHVNVDTAVIEHTLGWHAHSTDAFEDKRAYEHNLRLYNDGRSGMRPACNPFTERDFWADRSWTSWETTFPDAAKPYFDADKHPLLGVDASVSDGCDEADLTVGALLPREIPSGQDHTIRTESNRGNLDQSPFTVVPQNSGIHCGPFLNRWCVGLRPGQSEWRPAISRGAGETLPGCYNWSWNGDFYDHGECGREDLPITFSEFPLWTEITDQYVAWGVLFGGDRPVIASDGANPTSPVLSGQPIFSGDIEMRFVRPGTTTPTTVNEVAFDVGYINDPGAVIVSWYAIDGTLIDSRAVMQTGLPRFEIDGQGIHRVYVEVTPAERAGAAIDNVDFR